MSKKQRYHSEKALGPDSDGAVHASPEGAYGPPADAKVLQKGLGPRDPQRAAHLKRWRFKKGCKSPNPSGRPRSTIDTFEATILASSWRALLKILENPWQAVDPETAKLILLINKGLIKRLNEKHRNEGREERDQGAAGDDPVVVKFLPPVVPAKPEVPKEALVPATLGPGPQGPIE